MVTDKIHTLTDCSIAAVDVECCCIPHLSIGSPAIQRLEAHQHVGQLFQCVAFAGGSEHVSAWTFATALAGLARYSSENHPNRTAPQ